MNSSVGLSHRLQLFPSCSSTSPFRRVEESFGNRLLQHGLSMGSQILPENQLQPQFLSPQRCRPCQELAPAQPSQWVTASFGTSTCSGVGSSMVCRWISAPPMDCRGTAASPWSALWEKHLLLPLHWPWCLQGCSSPIFSLLSTSAVLQQFFPLKYILTEAEPLSLMGWALANVLELLGVGSVWCDGAAGVFPLPKPCPVNPMQFLKLFSLKMPWWILVTQSSVSEAEDKETHREIFCYFSELHQLK